MESTRSSHSHQVVVLTAAVGILVIATLGGFAWWAASRIDGSSLERQTQAVRTGLADLAARTTQEQQSSTLWDDAVLKVRERDDPWLAENLVDWMSSFFGHDRVYLLDPLDVPIRAVSNGSQVNDNAYELDRAALEPLVRQLRTTMASASAGLTESTEVVSELAVVDRVRLGEGEVGIVSVRPVVPSTDAVRQTPGEEYLHISVRLLDDDVAAEIAERFALQDLRFSRREDGDAGRASQPILGANGTVLGSFSWRPHRPATQLMQETGPVGGAAALLVGGIVVVLVGRLRRTSAQLSTSEQRAKYLAFHDALAGIPNRALFEDRLGRALASRRHGGGPVALHMVDIDHFKQVNDTLGHPGGDELIRQTAARLRAIISDADTVARLGGDEFAIIQVGPEKLEDVHRLGSRIVAELSRPFDLRGQAASVGASVGITVADLVEVHADDLVRQADIALYQAKANGRGRYELFAGELDMAVKERRALERELRAALEGEQGLELVYQPIFEARTGRLEGAEALVRWVHPQRGRLAPEMFIGLAEERGLIGQLGLWVLQTACAYASHSSVNWIAVNVSPLQFRDEDFADRVFAVLKATGLRPDRLELEITEGLLLQNSPSVQETLRRLRATGIRVALDDFGTGYSSISYLRTYGVDKLKIDRSYVAQLGEDLEVEHIVRCIIDLAHAMHMKVTAEGLETEAQRRVLQKLGCNQLQGYLLSRPVTPERLDALATPGHAAFEVAAIAS